MNSKTINELSSIKAELRQIIRELEQIRDSLNSDFQGIGTQIVASRLQEQINQYNQAINQLNNVNPNRLALWAQEGAGGGGGGW